MHFWLLAYTDASTGVCRITGPSLGGQALQRLAGAAVDKAADAVAVAALGGGARRALPRAPLALLPRHAAVPLHGGLRLPAGLSPCSARGQAADCVNQQSHHQRSPCPTAVCTREESRASSMGSCCQGLSSRQAHPES